MTTPTGKGHDIFTSRFLELEEARSRNGASWFSSRRREAFDRFGEMGFPKPRDEEWKYTNVAPIRKHDFVSADGDAPVDDNDLARLAIDGFDATRLVFVNGTLRAELSTLDALPSGVVVESLSAALSARREEVEPRLARLASIERHSFVALNTALAEDGAYIRVERNTQLEKPIHLQFVSTTAAKPSMAHSRVLIDVLEGAAVSVVEDYAGVDSDGVYWNNVVTEVFVAENARVEHQKLERESDAAFHVAAIAVHQGRSSTFVSNSFSFGGALVRNDISAMLDGEGIECTLNGLVVGSGSQHVDNHTRIVHAKPHCNSWEVYKAVLDDKARGVFNGKIYVAEDAQKTNAKQTNQALLLSEGAVMDAKPELEIYADDVKCTHGATVGQIDEESVFYLRSRGIDAQSARDLLIYAFARDVVDHLQNDALRRRIEEMLFAKLPKSRLLEESR